MARLMSVEERFWSKVERAHTDQCWVWTAGLNRSGYGWFKAHDVAVLAHRFAWTLCRGSIPDGLHVLHACDNRRCVNPRHLSLGTNEKNVADKMVRGRHPNSLMTECRHGHQFDEDNTYITPSGKRMCRACNRAAQRRYWRRKRGA